MQADFERAHSYPVAPHMDRTKTNRPRIAADFMDFVATPMFRVLSEFLPLSAFLMDYISQNRSSWQKGLDEVNRLAAEKEAADKGETKPAPKEEEVVDLNAEDDETENGEGKDGNGDKLESENDKQQESNLKDGLRSNESENTLESKVADMAITEENKTEQPADKP